MSGEVHPDRLSLARASLLIEWDAAGLRRLAEGLERRRRRRRHRRLIAGGMAVAAVLIVAFNLHRPRFPDPGSLGPTPGMASDGAPLADLARDGLRAQALLASYARTPDTHPTLPNVAYAGYHPGQRAAPERSPVVDVKSAPYHAAGDGVTDDTEAIRRALRAVEPGGGIVYFPDGQYLISGVLFVHGNGTVLRGASRDGVRLLFTRSLTATLGINADDRGESRWRWTGGLIWFAPRGHYTDPEPGEPLRWRGDGPVGAQFLGNVTSARARGDRTLEVANPGRVRAGALAVVAVDATLDLVAAGWRREPRPGQGGDFARVRWPVEVAAIEGHTVTLGQPLRFDLPLTLHPRLEALSENNIVRECGLERMTLVMRPRAEAGDAESAGWNGPFFQDAFHGFMREVTVIDGDQVFGAAASKNLTFADLKAGFTRLPGPDPRRGFAIRSSHDVLVTDVEMEGTAGFRARLEGSGIALSRVRGRLRWLTGRAVDSVLTELTLWGSPVSDGSSEALTGERVLGWRIDPGRSAARSPGGNLYEEERRILERGRP